MADLCLTHITIHCSDSAFGDAKLIDSWHKERGWKKIGYHFVVLNGRRSKNSFQQRDDGMVEYGRAINEIGAHVAGHNRGNLGVCLIGVRGFSPRQIAAAIKLVRGLMATLDIPVEHVLGHYEYDAGKTCPNMDMDWFRRLLTGEVV